MEKNLDTRKSHYGEHISLSSHHIHVHFAISNGLIWALFYEIGINVWCIHAQELLLLGSKEFLMVWTLLTFFLGVATANN